MRDDLVTLFLGGDVMLGRGVDQILPRPGDPVLQETYVRDARMYVQLAEAVNGAIPRPVDFAWPWGEALAVLDEARPDVRVLNLETSVTACDDFATGKGIHYRMNPANIPCLSSAHPDVCVLANNHVLDFGQRGLQETLEVLSRAGLTCVGAGRDAAEAQRPAAITIDRGGRVLVLSCGTVSSGIPPWWAATADRAGINVLSDLTSRTARAVTDLVTKARRPGDVVVASIHWGSNWGYDVPRDQIRFAHTLVDLGVDVVHGHSSHHPRPIEVYGERPILYGCGDLIDDYEGISGYEEYRNDLRLLYFVTLKRDTGKLSELRIVPMQARQMRLQRAAREDAEWIAAVLDRISRGFGARVDRGVDGVLTVRPR